MLNSSMVPGDSSFNFCSNLRLCVTNNLQRILRTAHKDVKDSNEKEITAKSDVLSWRHNSVKDNHVKQFLIEKAKLA